MFNIRVIPVPGRQDLRYEISLDDVVETSPLITTKWSYKEYEAQWKEALTALAKGLVQSCVLITDVQPKGDSQGIMYWALFRDAGSIFLQERFLRDSPDTLLGRATEIERSIPPRVQGSAEEHALVSEWRVSLTDIKEYVESIGGFGN
jgi:CdiI N-terminal domain